jgi:hypothetical protein
MGEKFAEGIIDALTPSVSYTDHCFVFMFMCSPDTLANRTADLISLNLSNFTQNAGRTVDNYTDMPLDTGDMYDLSKARTAFGVKTDYELNLMFLSMPFARAGVNGVTPPGTLDMSQTDYRGY